MANILSLNRALKRYDRSLVARKQGEKIIVYRKSKRLEPYPECNLFWVRDVEDYIFALTENWGLHGEAADWGIEPVMARLKSIDLAYNDVIGNLDRQYYEDERRRKKERISRKEDMLREVRPVFRDVFKDVNTASMEKIDKRREEDGNRKSRQRRF